MDKFVSLASLAKPKRDGRLVLTPAQIKQLKENPEDALLLVENANYPQTRVKAFNQSEAYRSAGLTAFWVSSGERRREGKTYIYPGDIYFTAAKKLNKELNAPGR